MSFQGQDFALGTLELDYLAKDSNGRLDGMVSHCLCNEALQIEEEAARKAKLAKKYEGTYMQDSGFCRGLREEADELNSESFLIKSYVFLPDEKKNYTH